MKNKHDATINGAAQPATLTPKPPGANVNFEFRDIAGKYVRNPELCYPPEAIQEILDSVPFMTADFRKLWPEIQKQVPGLRSVKRPIGDQQIEEFIRGSLTMPGVGAILDLSAANAGVGKRIRKRSDGDIETGRWNLSLDEFEGELPSRAREITAKAFFTAWMVGVVPTPAAIEMMRDMTPGHATLDMTRFLESLFGGPDAPEETVAPAPCTAPPTDPSPEVMYGALKQAAQSALSRLHVGSAAAEHAAIEECIQVMRKAAEAVQAKGRSDLAGQINALIATLQEWIALINQTAKNSVIEPLALDTLADNDPRASEELLSAAGTSVNAGSPVRPAFDELEAARKAVVETISDEDVLRAREAVRAYDDAVKSFSRTVDPVRALLAATPEHRATPELIISPSVRALLDNEQGIGPQAKGQAMPAAKGTPAIEVPVQEENAITLADDEPKQAPAQEEPSIPLRSVVAPESTVVAPVVAEVEPESPVVAPVVSGVAPARASVTRTAPTCVSADAQDQPQPTATTKAERVFAGVGYLIAQGVPGLALAVARLYEDAYLEELPGGPAFYTLLCSAAAGCSIEPLRYEGLDRHFESLLTQIVSAADHELEQAQAMAYLAAVIAPALFVRNASVTYHLPAVQGALGSPALEHLASVLQEPVQQRLESTPETLRLAAGNADHIRQQRMRHNRARARQIIDNLDGETRHDLTGHPNGQQTWKFIRSKEHQFGAALHALASGAEEADLLTKLRAAANHYAIGADEALDAAYSKFSDDRLISANRRRLLSAMENIDAFLQGVAAQIKPVDKDEGARLTVFANRLSAALSSAIDETESIRHEGIRGLAQAVLLHVMKATRDLLDAKDNSRPQSTFEDTLNRDLVMTTLDLGVEINGASGGGKSAYSLGREFVIHGDPALLVEQLCAHEQTAVTTEALAKACQQHLEAGRVISGMTALTYLRTADPENQAIGALDERYEAARISARQQLVEKAAKARRVIARASFSTLLPPAEIARMEASIERVLDLAKNLPIEGPVPGPLSNDEPRDFPSANEFLDFAILEPVDRKQAAALAQFEARVADERTHLRDPNAPAVDRVLALARQGQIVSAEEFWAQLCSGQELPKTQAGNLPLHVFHREFLPQVVRDGKLAKVLDELIILRKHGGKEFFGHNLDPSESEASQLLIDAWRQATTGKGSNVGGAVARFFTQLLGREAACTTPPSILGQVVFMDVTDIDFRKTIGNEAFVVPRVGSLSGGHFRIAVPVNNTTVVGVREAMAHHPDIVLTRARLSLDDRRKLYRDIRDTASNTGHGCLIIDEALLAFAAASPHSAASRIISVASTFLHTQPYKVENATVPEMFFGRRDAERQILESNSALIYGGRRLGKTSLIAEICRKFTSRASKKFFVHVELKQGLESHNYAATVWESIGKALVDDKVLQSTGFQFNTGSGSAVLNAIKKAFQEGRIAQLTLYLDEADVFMKYEESTQFAVLYEIHNELAMRFHEFRYAISGLNNVQRISLGWNTRLGRIGKPVAITPFIGDERHAGLRLICEPLAALGFEFEGEDLPLQILSAASFYPALIQAYCAFLLDNLYRRPIRGEPPYMITQKDLLEVESNEKLIKEMLDIFNYTVSLDPRYTAICGILAERQASSERIGDTAVPLSAITDRAVAVAPKLFPKGNPTVIVEAAAEALINLGILVRLPNTQLYQFRSPRILSRLRELPQVRDFLADPDATNVFAELDPSELRPKFADGSLCPLPLRMVNAICAPAREQEAVRMLAASPATGSMQLRKLANDTEWSMGRATVRQGMADTEAGLSALTAKLILDRAQINGKILLKRHQSNERELFVVSGNWMASAPSRLEAVDAQVRAQHRSVLLVCDPDRVWQIAAQPGARMAFLPLWTVPALRLHLQNEELTEFQGEATLGQLQSLTGGCGALVEVACKLLRQTREMPSHQELMSAAGVMPTLRGVCQFFGIRPEHEYIVQQVAAVSKLREEFEEILGAGGIGGNAPRLFTYLEWMGALAVNHKGHWSLNPALDDSLVDLA